ncbi:MAG: polysaccharide pyruvyl transferase family protein [Alphaproteobacteria bacterium]|jgi:hypothetical protein|nr:polysaccharide pyruvyl transferase family protein [Alphaproteobacteria bacterium]
MSEARPAPLRLYYYNNEQNFGDMLSPLLVEALCPARRVVWAEAKRCDLMAVGSILSAVDRLRKRARRAVLRLGRPLRVWGSGFLAPGPRQGTSFVRVHALRGKLSALRLGVADVPLGDPALLAARLLPQAAGPRTEEVVLAPHLQDTRAQMWIEGIRALFPDRPIRVVHLGENVDDVLRAIARARLVVASALHPLIVAHSYGTPCLWVDPQNTVTHIGGHYKFQDFYSATGMDSSPVLAQDLTQASDAPSWRSRIEDMAASSIIPPRVLASLQDDLVSVFPFA